MYEGAPARDVEGVVPSEPAPSLAADLAATRERMGKAFGRTVAEETTERLAAIEARLDVIGAILVTLETATGRMMAVLDSFESSPWGKMLRARGR